MFERFETPASRAADAVFTEMNNSTGDVWLMDGPESCDGFHMVELEKNGCAFNPDRPLPECGGLYVFHFADGSQYVGKSNNLWRRIAQYSSSMSLEQMEIVNAYRAENDVDPIKFDQTARVKALVMRDLDAGRPVRLEIIGGVTVEGRDIELRHYPDNILLAAESVVMQQRLLEGVALRNRALPKGVKAMTKVIHD